MKKSLIVAAILGLSSAAAQAQVTVSTVNGTPQNVATVNNFAVTGALMNGMDVTFTYANGNTGSTTLAWDSISGTASGAVGSFGILVSFPSASDTFNGTWRITNNNVSSDGSIGLDKVLFQGLPGNTVFDLTFGGGTGTPNSADGATFSLLGCGGGWDCTGSNQDNIRVTYSDIVSVGAAAAVGDLYANMLVDFTNPNFLQNGGFIDFRADTDNVTIAAIPEPETYALMALGLGLMGFVARRRKQQVMSA